MQNLNSGMMVKRRVMGSLPAFVCLYVKRNNRMLTMYVSCCLDNFLLKNLILFIFGKNTFQECTYLKIGICLSYFSRFLCTGEKEETPLSI